MTQPFGEELEQSAKELADSLREATELLDALATESLPGGFNQAAEMVRELTNKGVPLVEAIHIVSTNLISRYQ